MAERTKYKLAPGTQVREEDFGLLFYTTQGPRLFFLSCGELIGSPFFEGDFTLEEWIERRHGRAPVPRAKLSEIERSLQELKGKGVILER